jgi:cell division protein FtsW
MVAGIFSVLILMQPDLGTAGAIGVTVVVMLFVAGIKVTHFIFLMTSGFAGVLALIFSEDYRRERLLAFLDPWKDPLDTGFQYIQSLLAVGSGGLVGVGLGRSRQKFYYLPEQHTDFIYAVICEELGFIGAATIILLYLLFAWRGYQIALKAPDVFGSLLAAGITTMIILQAVLNIGVVTAVLPITGITLPLISYGGSSLVITMASVGVLLNISRFTTRQ